MQSNPQTHDLLELVISIGYHLQSSGAEIYRVEASVNKLLSAYGVPGDVFAVPNSIMITVCPDGGEPVTRIRRVVRDGIDMDSIERYNNLCRQLCRDTPPLAEAKRLFMETKNSLHSYSRPVLYLGYFLVAAGFTVYFHGTVWDGVLSGVCGMVVGFFLRLLTKLRVNSFFQTITASFWIAICCQMLMAVGVLRYGDSASIGALMLLVPGLAITESMRDILYGDTFSGINRLVQVMLTAAALFLGTGTALQVSHSIWSTPTISPAHAPWAWWIQVVMAALACGGFCLLYNIRGSDIAVCMIGGGVGWTAYLLALEFGASILLANFCSAIVISLYAEIMARIRKFPSSVYLVIALLPVVPGAGIYYTMEFLLYGEIEKAIAKGVQTASIAGLLAVGVLLVSSLFQMIRVAAELRKESLVHSHNKK